MEKQTKVLNKIKNSLVHGNEGQLGPKKNDECYTSMQDILNELKYWANLGKFQDKRIVCPCDWDVTNDTDIYGIDINYKEDPAEVNAFKAVKSVKITKVVEYPGTLFEAESEIKEEFIETRLTEYELKEDEIEDFLRDKLTCNFVRTLAQNARRWGIKSITASGYNPATDRGIKFQDVDYSKYDVCITNPPFSLYHEFMDTIVDKIDFIILCPLTNRANLFISIPLMEHKAYLGFGIELHLNFNNPTLENKFNTKIVNCDWITSYSEAQQERNNRHYKSGIKYETYKDEYIEMPNMTMKDGTHPIRVSMSTYPEDYSGWMFSTIGVLDNLDQDTYEWICTNCHKYFNTTYPEKNPFNHKFNGEMYKCADGKGAFTGILFRKKQTAGGSTRWN